MSKYKPYYTINPSDDDDDERFRRAQEINPLALHKPGLPAVSKPVPVQKPPTNIFQRMSIGAAIKGTNLLTGLEQSRKNHVLARHDREVAEQNELIQRDIFEATRPYIVESHVHACQNAALQGLCALEETLHRLQKQRLVHAREIEREAQQHITSLVEGRTKEKRARVHHARAQEIGHAEVDVELHQNWTQVASSQARQAEYHHRVASLQPKQAEKEERKSGFSKTMQENMKRSRVIHGDRRAAESKAGAIYLRSVREGRPLYDYEIEEIDQLLDGLDASEDMHRRSAASDLGLDDDED